MHDRKCSTSELHPWPPSSIFCVCMWKMKFKVGCHSTGHTVYLLLRKSLSVSLELYIRLHWLASKPQRALCLQCPCTNYKQVIFLMGFWGLNSDPQAWMASTLPTELFSQQPKNYFIDFVLKLLCSLISHSLPHFFLCPLSIFSLSFPFYLYFLPSPFILLFFLTGSYYESQASLVLEITPQSSNCWGHVYLIGQLVFLSVCGPKCALHSFLNRGINTF